MTSELIVYLQWFLSKWHTNGIHSLTREDFAELERQYLAAVTRVNEVEETVEEFIQTMNQPRSDAADKARLAAMKRLRAVKGEIEKQRTARRAFGTVQ